MCGKNKQNYVRSNFIIQLRVKWKVVEDEKSSDGIYQTA